MALVKGSKRCYEWLRQRKLGDVVSVQEATERTGWSPASLKTYLTKNKLAPFLLQLDHGSLSVLMDGKDISEKYFDEVFTQTAPGHVTLGVGDRLAGHRAVYELQAPIGSGAIGQVWSARNVDEHSEQHVAVKIMLPRQDLLAASRITDVRERFRREATNGQKIRHAHIVQYLDHGEIKKNPFLVMELGSGSIGGRLNRVGPLPFPESATVVADVADALSYLHGIECAHRDVKPDNILVFDGCCKLADLGIVKWTDFDRRFITGGTITRSSMQLGSWFYMAPEQQQDAHEATPASDVYALGVSWIEMLTGKLPSPHSIGAGQYSQPCDDPDVRDLIRRMVSFVAEERPSLAEVAGTVGRPRS